MHSWKYYAVSFSVIVCSLGLFLTAYALYDHNKLLGWLVWSAGIVVLLTEVIGRRIYERQLLRKRSERQAASSETEFDDDADTKQTSD